ncbi:hypothetical protein STEG23_002114 [Scotinomys teguina]
MCPTGPSQTLKEMLNILTHQRMQIKTTLRYHLTPVRMAKIKNTGTVHVGEDVEQEEHFSTVGGNADWYNHYGKQYGEFSENWESFFLQTQPYHSWAYTQRMPSHTQGHMLNYVHSSFICNSQNLKQPDALQEEWIRKMWFIYTMSTMQQKNNDIMKFAGKWMEQKMSFEREEKSKKNNHWVDISELVSLSPEYQSSVEDTESSQ